MIEINTKKMPNGNWSCYSTFNGYDHAFVSNSLENSQMQMIGLLKSKGLQEKVLFIEPFIHPKGDYSRPKPYDIPFLDFDPLG